MVKRIYANWKLKCGENKPTVKVNCRWWNGP